MPYKLRTIEEVVKSIQIDRKNGKTIVFTNGVFDLFHAGHVKYLRESKSHGDTLVIGLNSDESVKKIKGNNRPIISEIARAALLSELPYTDYIILFDDPTPIELIRAICPDVLIKGSDYKLHEVVGGEFVKSNGGVVTLVGLFEDISTTKIIETILERYCEKRVA